MTTQATQATRSRNTYRCGCPRRRLAARVPTRAVDELVSLYEQGASVSWLVVRSGYSIFTTNKLPRGRGVRMRRPGGSRAPRVPTTFQFPAIDAEKHRPGCPARADNLNQADHVVGLVRPRRRITHSVIVVGLVLAGEPGAELWLTEVARRAGMETSTMSRVLRHMLDDGWLSDRRELNKRAGLEPRRYYTPTPRGLTALRALCEHAQHNRDLYQKWLPDTFPYDTENQPNDHGQHEPAQPRTVHMRYFDDLVVQNGTPPLPPLPHADSPACGTRRPLREDDTPPPHTSQPRETCDGSYTHPAPTTEPANTDITNTDPRRPGTEVIHMHSDPTGSAGASTIPDRVGPAEMSIVCVRGTPGWEDGDARIRWWAELLQLLEHLDHLDNKTALDKIARTRIDLAAAGAFGEPPTQRWDEMPSTAQATLVAHVREVLLAAIVTGYHLVPAEPITDQQQPPPTGDTGAGPAPAGESGTEDGAAS